MNRLSSRLKNHIAITAAAVTMLSLVAAHAGIEITPADDFEAIANTLGPGDELVLGDGVYSFNENIGITIVGTADQPVVIRAGRGAKPILEQQTDQHNVVEIKFSEHLILRGLTVRGGSHGIRLIDSDYITIEDSEIYETGDVAISANTKGTYEGLQILRNHIHHTNNTGEGMYLGCNNDTCRIANSLIEGNYIHHTNGPTVTQGDGIEIKKGSYGNLVRNNVIHDTKYPGILLYSTNGNGAANIVEGNVIWNVEDNTIQFAADTIVRNNIILGNVAIQPHQGAVPGNIEFVHNTVINTGHALQMYNVSGPVLIANNAIYSETGHAIRLNSGDGAQLTASGNVGMGGLFGIATGWSDGGSISDDLTRAHFAGAPPIEVFPQAESPLVNAADPDYTTVVDFNGLPRKGSTDSGAYRCHAAGNPGWQITTGFKQLIVRPRGGPANAPARGKTR